MGTKALDRSNLVKCEPRSVRKEPGYLRRVSAKSGEAQSHTPPPNNRVKLSGLGRQLMRVVRRLEMDAVAIVKEWWRNTKDLPFPLDIC
jgi:hypothetical protein